MKNKNYYGARKGQNPAVERMRLEQRIREENSNARNAGKEYGILAMGIIALMATIAKSDIAEIQKYIIDASDLLSKNTYTDLNEVVNEVNAKMGSEVTVDQLIKVDLTLSAFLK